MENNKPGHIIICKILGILLLVASITLIVFGVKAIVSSFADVGEVGDSAMPDIAAKSFGNIFKTFGLLAGGLLCLGVSIALLYVGFKPEIVRLKTKTVKYVVKDNKEDFQDIATTGAEIVTSAITKTVSSIKQGLKEAEAPAKVICESCGRENDATTKFCNYCGAPQNK